VVGRQPNAPAAFTPGEIPGTHFQRLSRPQGTWFFVGSMEKIPSGTADARSKSHQICKDFINLTSVYICFLEDSRVVA